VLQALEVPGYVMRVNNRKILDGMMERVGATGDDKFAVLRGVDKLPKIGKDGVVAELLTETSLDEAAIGRLFEVLERPVGNIDELEQLTEMFGDTGKAGVAELSELLRIVEAAGYSGQVEVDLSIARGLDYYTGTIYETFVLEREGYGSVMSGGRYDDLLGMFLKESVPAVGISLGVDRLLSVLEDLGLVKPQESVADVYIALVDDEGFGEMAAMARQLREAGLNVEQSLKVRKLGKQFKAAHNRGIRYVLLAGSDERAAQTVSLKDMDTGDQVSIAAGEAAAWLTERTRP